MSDFVPASCMSAPWWSLPAFLCRPCGDVCLREFFCSALLLSALRVARLKRASANHSNRWDNSPQFCFRCQLLSCYLSVCEFVLEYNYTYILSFFLLERNWIENVRLFWRNYAVDCTLYSVHLSLLYYRMSSYMQSEKT